MSYTGSIAPLAGELRACLKCIATIAVVGGFFRAAPAQDAPATDVAQAQTTEQKQPEAKRFNVREYRVLGNTVLGARDIERVLYPLLGDGKQLADVDAARAALEKIYHERGFGTVFVDVPPQEVADGVVRLQVTEGRLQAKTISGARFFSDREVIAALPAAALNEVPNLPALQQQLATLNSQSADRSVVPVLKAGPIAGTMDVEFKVSDQLPLHGSLEVDNDYTVDTNPLRATAALSYANLFGALDQVSLQYQDTPQSPGQVSVLNISYLSRPFVDGVRANASFTNSNSNVGAVGGGAVGVLGKGQIYSVRLSYPIQTMSQSVQSLNLGMDYKHFRDAVTLGGGSQLVTPIYYTNLSVAYLGTWTSNAFDGGLSASVNFGPRGIPNSADAFENKRFLGRPNYFYLRWDSSLTAHLPAGFRLNLRFAGQEAVEPLISNENFSIGGADGVRGYLEAEELGDSGIKASVQLQTPTWSRGISQLLNIFAYYDTGRTRVIDALSNQPDGAVLRSWGGGLNMLPGHAFSGSLTWSDPLDNGSYTLAHQSRVLFLIRGTF